MKNISFKNSQAGFTLVEIAIVLVIIGLLLGGVLKGTELIESAKVKRAVNEINGVTTAFFSYQDRYQQLPGDDGPIARITPRGAAWTAFTFAGNANGIIVAPIAQTFAPVANTENEFFWKGLKASGFISGDAAGVGAAVLPRNAFGGLIGFTVGPVGPVPAANQLAGRIVCLSQVPGKSAGAIDTQLDDGNGNTGRVRGLQVLPGANPAPTLAAGPVVYSEALVYTLCQQF